MARIWVDADACPKAVREVIYRASARLDVEVVMVANAPVPLPWRGRVRAELVGAGSDRADDRIVERLAPGDLVVTDDVPLAVRAVEAGAVVVRSRGGVIDEDNARGRLSERDFMAAAREAGVIRGAGRPYDKHALKRFAAAFDRELTRALRRANQRSGSG